MPMDQKSTEGLPTPGPSSPNTPTKGILSGGQNQDGVEVEVDGDYGFGDLGDLGDDWDEEAQAELDAFLEDDSDIGSEAARYVDYPTSIDVEDDGGGGRLADSIVHVLARRHQGHHRRNE